MEMGISQLVGPLMAESIDDDKKLINDYVPNNQTDSIREDKYISAILNDRRIVLSGVRGTGKTMILKVANEILKNDLDYNLHYVNEWERTDANKKVLPVYVTYSGFKEEVSLQSEQNITDSDMTTAKEIFRSYFFMSLLQDILSAIDKLNLDKEVEFNFLGLLTKCGIKKEVDKAINEIKRKGFRELTEAKNKGQDAGVKISLIELNLKNETSKQTKSNKSIRKTVYCELYEMGRKEGIP